MWTQFGLPLALIVLISYLYFPARAHPVQETQHALSEEPEIPRINERLSAGALCRHWAEAGYACVHGMQKERTARASGESTMACRHFE